MNVLGNNIRRLREQSGMSQDELAEILSCTRQTVSNYERGVSEPDLESIRKMADIFSCDINELINEENKKDRKIIVNSLIRTIVIETVCLVLYLISLRMFPVYFNNALLITRIMIIPAGLYFLGVFIGDVLSFYNIKIKNNIIRKVIRIILIVFLSVDIVILMPALIYNLYIMIMKLIKTGNISFSFNGGLFYYRFACPFVIINMRCSWIFALVGIGMRLSKMKKVTNNENKSQKNDENILYKSTHRYYHRHVNDFDGEK